MIGLGLAILWSLGALWQGSGPEALGHVWQARWTGYGSLSLLLLSLAMRPAAELGLVSPASRVRWRREFGIGAAGLATIHLVLVQSGFLQGQFWFFLADTAWLQVGAAALVVLWCLWFTSYPVLVRAVKLKNWVALHRLAYLAGLLAVIHASLCPWSDPRLILALGMFFAICMAWRWPIGLFMLKFCKLEECHEQQEGCSHPDQPVRSPAGSDVCHGSSEPVSTNGECG
ncbi:MAG: ferric reductase-like transmembrane domain-containing protein [Candidatus Eremiobacteraeota bacterium]|nr:ferric reductase-like transmembrane domain-containing protein [Candidatus Eremiobacteraeota bacterium]